MIEHKPSGTKPSRSRYVMGCRCFGCRVANADYHREYQVMRRRKKLRGEA